MMTIKNGKFFKDGVQVPIEHGNKEQIEILMRIKEYSTSGLVPLLDIYQVVVMQFTCVCGAINNFTFNVEDDSLETIGEEDECHDCKMKYRVFDDEDEGLVLKMIP